MNLFTADYLDEQLGRRTRCKSFSAKRRRTYREDRIFDERERLNLKPATGREIVRLLERYNLSDTSEDVKGIAFERFLGKTFRGEIGQFFTPANHRRIHGPHGRSEGRRHRLRPGQRVGRLPDSVL